ncbi:MAG: hypothetical protein RLW62_23695, partial [Gammaproteobacteria bacterium]
QAGTYSLTTAGERVAIEIRDVQSLCGDADGCFVRVCGKHGHINACAIGHFIYDAATRRHACRSLDTSGMRAGVDADGTVDRILAVTVVSNLDPNGCYLEDGHDSGGLTPRADDSAIGLFLRGGGVTTAPERCTVTFDD